MAKEGILILTVPAFNFLWSPEDVFAGHFRRYTLNTISKVLHNAGFKVHYSTYIFSFLVPVIFIMRSLFGKFKKENKTLTESAKSDHTGKGISMNILNKIMQWEQKKVSQRKRIFLGSSCLVVASKK